MNDRLRIILADDHADDRLLLARELRHEFPGLDILHIIDAEEFAQVLATGQFDLAITDSQLGWTNGLALLQAIKATLPDCPVIMFTGTGSEEIAVEAMKAGLHDYILKSPQHVAPLLAAVRSGLAVAQRRLVRQGAELRYEHVEEACQRQQEILYLSEQLATMGQLLAGVTHELNNPLSVILGHATLLQQSMPGSLVADRAEKIKRSAERCARIVANFPVLARQRPPAPQPVPPSLVVGEAAAGAMQGRGPAGQTPTRGIRSLVLVDEPGLAGALAEVLQLDGHIVEIVEDGNAALEKLQEQCYDLVLSDSRMPGLSSPDFYRAVERRDPALVRRMILLTGDMMSPETRHFLQQTGVPCLRVPFTVEMVRQAVHCVLAADGLYFSPPCHAAG
jgi:DNA-binding NtrC family response regulator